MRSLSFVIIPLIWATALVACATAPLTPEQTQQLEAPQCEPTTCAAMWQSAQVWVINNSRYKIQLANDVLIQTYTATNGDIWLGYAVTKEPLGGGRYQLIMRAGCDNPFGCQPLARDAIINFNNAMRATQR